MITSQAGSSLQELKRKVWRDLRAEKTKRYKKQSSEDLLITVMTELQKKEAQATTNKGSQIARSPKLPWILEHQLHLDFCDISLSLLTLCIHVMNLETKGSLRKLLIHLCTVFLNWQYFLRGGKFPILAFIHKRAQKC